MRSLFLCLGLWLSQIAWAGPQKLVLAGGGHSPEMAYRYFAKNAGGENGRFLVITWATSDPQGSFDWFKERIGPYVTGSSRVEQSPLLEEMDQAESIESFTAQLEAATGIYFTGGHQDRFMSVIKNHRGLRDLIQAKYDGGKAVLMGTSAGTAIMSDPMLNGKGSGEPPFFWTEEGLGFLPGILVDQHFFVRQREERLTLTLKKLRIAVGVGVDEGSAAVVESNRWLTAVGPEQNDPNVLILNQDKLLAITRKELKNGDRWDLEERF